MVGTSMATGAGIEQHGSANVPHSKKGKPRLLMSTAVWGDWHMMVHLTVNLPTLLAPGNLPTLAAACDMQYLIFTRRSDFTRIEADPAIAKIRALGIDVTIEFLPPDILKDPIAAHHAAWDMATKRAGESGSLLLLMPPDVAWGGRSFGSVVDRLERGDRAVFMTYLRAESVSFVKALNDRKSADSVALDISQNDMVDLCVRSFHPLMAASVRDSDFFPTHPEMILWPVPGEGFAVRVLAREMFLFDPSYFNLNHAALPDLPLQRGEASFICDSDDLFAVSLAEIGKDVQWHIRPQEASPMTIAPWWLRYDSKSNDFMAAQKIRWHFKPVTEAKWRAVEAGCDVFVRRLAAVREGMRVWQIAQTRTCTQSGRILAYMLNTGALARAVKGREGAIVFLPKNEAFEKSGGKGGSNHPDLADEAALIQLVKAHYVPLSFEEVESDDPIRSILNGAKHSQLDGANGPLTVAVDNDGAITVGGAKVVSKPIKTGSITIYLIDDLIR